jgi:hypothetical protein
MTEDRPSQILGTAGSPQTILRAMSKGMDYLARIGNADVV